MKWCEENDLSAVRMAFGDLLKESAAACFGIPANEAIEWCDWLKRPGVFVTAQRKEGADDLVERRVSGRQFLQFYGTEAHRDVFGDHFWADAVDRATYDLEADVVFLTDVRFDNEANLVHRHGGEVWEVVRPGLSAVEAHASEGGVPEGAIEFQIVNDGGLEDLRSLICSVCNHNLKETK